MNKKGSKKNKITSKKRLDLEHEDDPIDAFVEQMNSENPGFIGNMGFVCMCECACLVFAISLHLFSFFCFVFFGAKQSE